MDEGFSLDPMPRTLQLYIDMLPDPLRIRSKMQACNSTLEPLIIYLH